eukprot:scaffold1912_cov135-Cylindrotheca_fusiformis.AAC.21
MPVVSPALASAFASDGPRGTTFFESISFPRKDESLHALLLDENLTNPTAAVLQHSMGHRITSTAQKNHVMEPNVFLPQQDRQSYGITQFGVLNDQTRLGGAQLQQFQDHQVGAPALIVSLGSGNTPFITVVANPTIMPVDPTNQEDFGAPYWDEALLRAWPHSECSFPWSDPHS